MIKKVKGLKVQKQLVDKFKFNRDGTSQIGSDTADTHAVTGTMGTSGNLALTGELVLDRRISETLFGVPQIDGSTGTAELQDLITNVASYDGFIVYLTNASSLTPFVESQKFYFCENGEWHPSPFINESTDSDGDGIPDTEDPFTTETVNGTTNIVLNTTNLTNDPIFETDASGDVMIDASPSGTNGNFELDDQGDVMPAAS